MREALAAALHEEIATLTPIAGGDLNDAFCATLAGGRRAFVKTAPDAAPGAYAAEAAGLRWLGQAGGLPVPEVLAVGERYLALAWIEPGHEPLDAAALGRGLAQVHRAGAAAPGALPPGVDGNNLILGPLALPNDPVPSWPAFYAANRLLPLARMAADRGALDRDGVAAVERVCARIDDLAGPAEPHARLHGDLWSGNVHAGADGRPWLIDPAAYGGHREIDLAMLSLFGSVSAA
ncbi:MAG TPA: fructosamine kinase family protein, partial [Baekduia sp.]|nr:fructosamine kinase family protein [Baekduia sp.]